MPPDLRYPNLEEISRGPPASPSRKEVGNPEGKRRIGRRARVERRIRKDRGPRGGGGDLKSYPDVRFSPPLFPFIPISPIKLRAASSHLTPQPAPARQAAAPLLFLPTPTQISLSLSLSLLTRRRRRLNRRRRGWIARFHMGIG